MRATLPPAVIRLIVAAGLLGTMLVAPATAQTEPAPQTQSQTSPAVTVLDPLPGAVLSPGDVPVRLAVRTTEPLDATLSLDGEEVSRLRFTEPIDGVFAVMVVVPEGRHTLVVQVDDVLVQAVPIRGRDPQVTGRVANVSPTATAVELARRQFPSVRSGSAGTTTASTAPASTAPASTVPASAAVLVGEDAVADALAAIPLAAHLQAPLLVATRDQLPEDTASALTDLVEPGGDVLVLGGEAVIGPGVLEEIAALGLTPSRHAGADRTQTAALIADLLPPSPQAFLVAGGIGVDAVAVSALAAAEGTPILLTTQDVLPTITAQALSRLGTERVVVVGGTAVVGDTVAATAADLGLVVERLAGPDRITTSVMTALLAPRPTAGVSLVTTADPLTALLAANDSAKDGRPLVFLDGGQVTASIRSLLPQLEPGPVVVYGSGIDEATARTVDLLLADDGPVVTGLAPATASGHDGLRLPQVGVTSDRPLDVAASRLSLLVATQGIQLPLSLDPSGTVLTADASNISLQPTWSEDTVVHAIALLVGMDGTERFLEWTWTFTPASPTYATVQRSDGRTIELAAPSTAVQLIGLHQASSDGALPQTVTSGAPPAVVMPSRGRGTAPTSAADVVADPAFPLLAPVSGTVVLAEGYQLYCQHEDERLTIRPDDHPDLEVTLLHVTGLRVAVGDHVKAGRTTVADGARPLPFESQVDRYTDENRWPHTHIQVVDPTLVTRPSPTC